MGFYLFGYINYENVQSGPEAPKTTQPERPKVKPTPPERRDTPPESEEPAVVTEAVVAPAAAKPSPPRDGGFLSKVPVIGRLVGGPAVNDAPDAEDAASDGDSDDAAVAPATAADTPKPPARRDRSLSASGDGAKVELPIPKIAVSSDPTAFRAALGSVEVSPRAGANAERIEVKSDDDVSADDEA